MKDKYPSVIATHDFTFILLIKVIFKFIIFYVLYFMVVSHFVEWELNLYPPEEQPVLLTPAISVGPSESCF